MKLRLGTRGSKLALTQSNWVKSQLEAHGHEVTLEIIQTQGDLHRDVAFENLGAAGVFVRSLEQALLRGEVDLAVHSYKDLPSDSPEGLVVAAIPERRDPADVLLVRQDALDESADGPLPLASRRAGGDRRGPAPRAAARRPSRPPGGHAAGQRADANPQAAGTASTTPSSSRQPDSIDWPTN